MSPQFIGNIAYQCFTPRQGLELPGLVGCQLAVGGLEMYDTGF